MKYICLSFDDARSDTYDIAYPIMQKYGLKATVNVVTDYIFNPNSYKFTAAPKAMTKEQLLEWQQEGYEIAVHGKTHHNTLKDVCDCIEDLKVMGIDVSNIGFASPNSELSLKNIQESGIDTLMQKGTILYIRSGIQIRRKSLLYIIGAAMEKFTHSKRLFWRLNRQNIISSEEVPSIIPAVAVKDYTKVKQILYLIDHMEDGNICVLMFHSILPKRLLDNGGKYYCWSEEQFEELCKEISGSKDITVTTTYKFVRGELNER